MAHLVIYTMNAGFIDIIQTDVGSQAQHQNTLYHVRTDHATSSNNHKFVICQEIHKI